ncbi:MAG: phosphoesterase [Rhodobacterales bacterium]|nr:phosphoesterase [Rhodobacterales bacterium]
MSRKKNQPTRRQALQGLGAAALLPVASCAKDVADSGQVDNRSLEDLLKEHIDVVVVVMMENRSFDHYLGHRSLNEGDTEVDGLTDGLSNPHPDGSTIAPFKTGVDCVYDPPHSWSSCHEQFNEGANDGFVSEFYGRTTTQAHEAMGYHDREMIPTLNAMADHFTVCDRWFCSLMTSTWPNRFYSHCAQSGGVTGNTTPTEDMPSIYTKFNEADVDWGCYFANVPTLLLVPDRVVTDPQIQPIENFFEQAAAGTLPKSVVIEPLFGYNDDHPPEHPLAGQIFLASIYEALAQSPQWERCVLLITYDEHGGFYDHVPPPTAADDRASEGFDQLGFRVPSVVVSPWSKPGHVSHEVFDHTSMLALQELLYDIEPLSARDAAANPLLDCFDEEALRSGIGHAPVSMPEIAAKEEDLWREECIAGPLAVPGERPWVSLGQPELEDFADVHLAGTPLDRRAQGNEIYEFLLQQAELLGVLKRDKPL